MVGIIFKVIRKDPTPNPPKDSRKCIETTKLQKYKNYKNTETTKIQKKYCK